MSIIAITGHRPKQLGSPDWSKDALRYALVSVGTTHLIQGMAEGADLLSAGVAWQMGIPFTGVRPWAGHDSKDTPEMYEWAMRNAEDIIVLNESLNFPGNASYHVRNEWMVNKADSVIALWDGSSKGGTAAAVRYAYKTGKPVFIIDPRAQKIVGYLD